MRCLAIRGLLEACGAYNRIIRKAAAEADALLIGNESVCPEPQSYPTPRYSSQMQGVYLWHRILMATEVQTTTFPQLSDTPFYESIKHFGFATGPCFLEISTGGRSHPVRQELLVDSCIQEIVEIAVPV